jgi:hypothetical protein
MSQDFHSCPDAPTTINRFLSTLSGVGTGEGVSLLTPLPEVFSGVTLLSPLASCDDPQMRLPSCRACRCLMRYVERSYGARFWSCPQCRLVILDKQKPLYRFSTYGWIAASIGDLASYGTHQLPETWPAA